MEERRESPFDGSWVGRGRGEKTALWVNGRHSLSEAYWIKERTV